MKVIPVIIISCALFVAQLPAATAQIKKPAAKSTKKSSASAKPAIKATSSGTTAKTVVADSAKTVKKDNPLPVKALQAQAAPVTATVVPVAVAPTPQPVKSSEQIDPFKKGTFSFISRKNIDYTYFKSKPYGEKTSDLLANVDLNYFFMNHLAVGINFTYRGLSTKATYPSSYNYYRLLFNLTYGRMITPRVGAYIRATGGFGHSRSQFQAGQYDIRILEASYTNLGVTIGVPISMQKDNPLFVTPYIAYDHQQTKAANHTITDKGFTMGVRLETYITGVGIKKGKSEAGAWPQKGASFIDFSTQGGFGFSKRTDHQNGSSIVTVPVKTKSGNFSFGYQYYFMDYFAAGLNVNLSFSSTDNGASVIKDNTIGFEPTVTAHLPMEGTAHNLFLQIGYRFEHESNGFKLSSHYLPVRLGYNLFLTKYLSFTPKIGYQLNHTTTTSAGGDQKSSESGLAVDIGFRCWIK